MEIRLFTPGPTPVPPEVREAESLPMIHHRSEEFTRIFTGVRDQLKRFLDTDGEVILFASSGSGGMEASVSSLFSPGDEVVIVEGGKFGERWVELAKHFRLSSESLHIEWGKSATVEEVLKRIKPTTKGLLIQACESSTGAYHPIQKLGEALQSREDLLFVVDGITAVGVHDISMRRDRIDALIGGSQKALMCAPGLAVVGLSKRALSKLSQLTSQSFYFSLQRELKNQIKGQTAFTPAISLIRSLAVAMDRLEKTGRENVFRQHKKLQTIARASLREGGLNLFNSDEDATWGITVVQAPDGLDVKSWLKELKTKHGLWLVGGQGKLEGKIFRFSHMGACTEADLAWALNTIRKTLR